MLQSSCVRTWLHRHHMQWAVQPNAGGRDWTGTAGSTAFLAPRVQSVMHARSKPALYQPTLYTATSSYRTRLAA